MLLAAVDAVILKQLNEYSEVSNQADLALRKTQPQQSSATRSQQTLIQQPPVETLNSVRLLTPILFKM